MTGDALTIAEVMEATGASERTVRRRLAERAFPGAYREGPEPTAAWRIPVEDLALAGLHLRPGAALLEGATPDAALVVVRRAEDRAAQAEARERETALALARAEDRVTMLEELVRRVEDHRAELQASSDLLAVERAERLEELQGERDHLRAQVEALQAALAAPRRRWWQRG